MPKVSPLDLLSMPSRQVLPLWFRVLHPRETVELESGLRVYRHATGLQDRLFHPRRAVAQQVEAEKSSCDYGVCDYGGGCACLRCGAERHTFGSTGAWPDECLERMWTSDLPEIQESDTSAKGTCLRCGAVLKIVHEGKSRQLSTTTCPTCKGAGEWEDVRSDAGAFSYNVYRCDKCEGSGLLGPIRNWFIAYPDGTRR